MWYVILIDFLILNHSCIPGINISWSWFMFLLIYCWIWLVTLYWGILHLCSLVILVCNLLFVWYIYLILESVWCWSCRMILETFFPLHSSWIVCESVKFCQNDWAQFCQNLSEFTCNNMVLDLEIIWLLFQFHYCYLICSYFLLLFWSWEIVHV